jgi:hypothetical protein
MFDQIFLRVSCFSLFDNQGLPSTPASVPEVFSFLYTWRRKEQNQIEQVGWFSDVVAILNFVV